MMFYWLLSLYHDDVCCFVSVMLPHSTFGGLFVHEFDIIGRTMSLFSGHSVGLPVATLHPIVFLTLTRHGAITAPSAAFSFSILRYFLVPVLFLISTRRLPSIFSLDRCLLTILILIFLCWFFLILLLLFSLSSTSSGTLASFLPLFLFLPFLKYLLPFPFSVIYNFFCRCLLLLFPLQSFLFSTFLLFSKMFLFF